MAEAVHRKRRFTESSEPLLTNPHKGCATFQRLNGDPLNPGTQWSEQGPLTFPPAQTTLAEGCLPCTLAYCRWFWNVIEPERGHYDWSMVERALTTTHERGQSLQVRLMPHGSARQPQLPEWYRGRGGRHCGTKHVSCPLVLPFFVEEHRY